MSEKMAFFVISTHLGGAERSLLEFLENSTLPMPVLVVTPKSEGPLIDELKQLNIPLRTLTLPDWVLKISRNKPLYSLLIAPFLPFVFVLQLIKIKKLISSEKISRIHSTGLKFHILLTCHSMFNKKVKLFIHLRDIIHSSWLKTYFSFFKNSSQISFLANSQVTAQSLPKVSSQIIYNGFSEKKYYSSSSLLKKNLKIPSQHKLVGLIGAIARWKGQREFVEVAIRISKEHKDIHFLIVGNEIYDTKGETGELAFLKEKAKDFEQIQFLDFQSDLLPVYNALDVLTHCSIEPEPFGRVVVEAILCGTPVTASNHGGPLEIIDNEKNGLLHDMKNLSHLENNILRLIKDPEFSNKLAQQALEDSKKFKMSCYVKNMENSLFTNI